MAARAARGPDQSRASTSSCSGNRPACLFENTVLPSTTTSNCPDAPASIAAACSVCSLISAARLAARRSYPLQTGQYRISTSLMPRA
jgi:hypothetical protein